MKEILVSMIKYCLLVWIVIFNVPTGHGQTKGDLSLPSTQEQLEALIRNEKRTFKYSVDDFFARPRKSSFQLSPDGKYLSYFEKDTSGKMHLYTQNLYDNSTKRQIQEKEQLIRGYMWLSEKYLLYYHDQNGDENYKLYLLDIGQGNITCMTPYDNVSAEVLHKPSAANPDKIIVLMNKDDPESSEPYEIDILTNQHKRLFVNKDHQGLITNYYFNNSNQVNAYIAIEHDTSRVLYYRQSYLSPFQKVLESNWTDKFELLGWITSTSSEHDAYMITNVDRDKLEIVEFDLQKGRVKKRLFSNEKFDLEGFSFSRKRSEIDYYYFKGERWHNVPVSKRYGKILERLQQKLIGNDFIIYSRTVDESKLLLDVYSDKIYHKYYLYDVDSDSLKLLVNLLPHLQESEMASCRPIQFRSRDGLELFAYLYIPGSQESNTKFPLLVNPHGGPFEVRNEWGFNREAQLFASRGYATLQINFRGSGGFGKEFLKAGYNQIGQKMLEDLEDGVNYVVSMGIVDVTKIAIYGGSYGGLATLQSLIKTPDLYVCGIDHCGISNLMTYLNYFPPQWKKLLQKTYREWYDPNETDQAEIIKKVSPVLNSGRITKPLLVAHGANDPRVKIEESDAIVKSLREKGIEVPYIVKYNEGHGFAREVNRIELYKVMLGFLAKCFK